MLEGLRVASQNWIGRTIMALVMGVIVISFSIWGVGDVFRGMTAVFAAHYKPGLRQAFMAHVRRHAHQAPGPMLRITGRQLAAYGYRLC